MIVKDLLPGIFSYLNVYDRINVRLVCKLWRAIIGGVLQNWRAYQPQVNIANISYYGYDLYIKYQDVWCEIYCIVNNNIFIIIDRSRNAICLPLAKTYDIRRKIPGFWSYNAVNELGKIKDKHNMYLISAAKPYNCIEAKKIIANIEQITPEIYDYIVCRCYYKNAGFTENLNNFI